MAASTALTSSWSRCSASASFRQLPALRRWPVDSAARRTQPQPPLTASVSMETLHRFRPPQPPCRSRSTPDITPSPVPLLKAWIHTSGPTTSIRSTSPFSARSGTKGSSKSVTSVASFTTSTSPSTSTQCRTCSPGAASSLKPPMPASKGTSSATNPRPPAAPMSPAPCRLQQLCGFRSHPELL